VLLVAITLCISTVAVTNDGISEGNISRLADSTSPIGAQEVTIVGRVGKVYDYRSNNGIISPLSYISVPQRGYRKFRKAMRQFQKFPSVLQRGGNSSDSGDGSSVKNNESENTNTSKVVISPGYTLPIRAVSSNTAETVGGSSIFYRDNYGTHPTVRYILAPQVGYQAYGEEESPFQLSLAMDKSSSDPGLNNSTLEYRISIPNFIGYG
ncbi:hypothetical protein AVEN_121109-1, partial [Araneus ventricosus]